MVLTICIYRFENQLMLDITAKSPGLYEKLSGEVVDKDSGLELGAPPTGAQILSLMEFLNMEPKHIKSDQFVEAICFIF